MRICKQEHVINKYNDTSQTLEAFGLWEEAGGAGEQKYTRKFHREMLKMNREHSSH